MYAFLCEIRYRKGNTTVIIFWLKPEWIDEISKLNTVLVLFVNLKLKFCFSSVLFKWTSKSKIPIDDLMKISPELEAVIGVKEASRAEVIKKIWIYVKKNNLQDPENKAIVMCDDKLKKLSGESKFRAFDMNKFLGKHICLKNATL